MTKTVQYLLLSLLALSLQATPTNYGDFAGTNVTYLSVTETDVSVGDPTPLFGGPIIGGDQLSFLPTPGFSSSAASGSSDVTTGLLETTIMALGGETLLSFLYSEAGDATLTEFPPFGTPDTNAEASLTGTLTVIEDLGGPIVPVVIPFVGVFAPADAFALPGDFGLTPWTASVLVDIAAVVPNATKAELALTNSLESNAGAGDTSALIQKTSATLDVEVPSTAVPEPSSVVLVAFGLIGLGVAVRRRNRAAG